jgi:hypothetical protein
LSQRPHHTLAERSPRQLAFVRDDAVGDLIADAHDGVE